MQRILFLDANVVLDFVLQREEFKLDARKIFELRDTNKAEPYVSALTLAHVAYFAKRFGKNAYTVIKNVLDWVKVVDSKKYHFEQVLLKEFPDFEDGLQYFSALEVSDLDAIITRNKKDFIKSKIPVFTPAEFIKLHYS